MDFKLHLIIVVVLAAFCIFRFVKSRGAHEIVIAIWAGSTLLQYLSDDKTFIRILGVAQILFFLLVIYLLFRRKPQGNKGAVGMMKEAMSEASDDEIENKNGENQ